MQQSHWDLPLGANLSTPPIWTWRCNAPHSRETRFRYRVRMRLSAAKHVSQTVLSASLQLRLHQLTYCTFLVLLLTISTAARCSTAERISKDACRSMSLDHFSTC